MQARATIFFFLALLIGSSRAQLTCFEPGFCGSESFLITEVAAEDANHCLFACQDETDPTYDCQWWSWTPNGGGVSDGRFTTSAIFGRAKKSN